MAWFSTPKWLVNVDKNNSVGNPEDNTDFYEWIKNTKWEWDHLLTDRLYQEFIKDKTCILDNTSSQCIIMQEELVKEWEYLKISKKTKKSFFQKIRELRHIDELEHIDIKDLKNVISQNFKSTIWWVFEIPNFSLILKTLKSGAYEKAWEMIWNIVSKRIPAAQVFDFWLNSLTDLISIWKWKRKQHEKNEKIKPKVLFEFWWFEKHIWGELVWHETFKNIFRIQWGHLISELDSTKFKFVPKRIKLSNWSLWGKIYTVNWLERWLIIWKWPQGEPLEKPSTMFPRWWTTATLIQKLRTALNKKMKSKSLSKKSNLKLNWFKWLDTTVRLQDWRKGFQVVVAYTISVNKKTKVTKINIITAYPKQDR